MNILSKAILLSVGCLLAQVAKADLLGVSVGHPKIFFVEQSDTALTYNPDMQQLVVEAFPAGIEFSPFESAILIADPRSIEIDIDSDGNLLSGANGFRLTGQFIWGTTNFSGTLLEGDVTAFGYADSGVTDQYDFRVHITGGQLMQFFTCGDLAVNVTSENSTFSGVFTEEFHGSVKGDAGQEDKIPPTIICPGNSTCPPTPGSQIVTTPATDPQNPDVHGFIVTYPDPIIADNCDSAPLVFPDIPSGTFLPLNAGESVTITIFVVDTAGNFDFCSFDVVMCETQQGGCPIAFDTPPCPPITLGNDAGKCYATCTFTVPVATNCLGQLYPATRTAVDQGGAMIPLTDLGNGSFSGQFPKTTTGTNVITFTSDDGQGNTAVRQCLVSVADTEAPTLICLNQAGTFKPVFTNGVSSITAKLSCNDIPDDKTIWFSSVINTPSGSKAPFTVRFFDQVIELDIDEGTNLLINVPEAIVTFSNGVAIATTTFVNGNWVTVAKPTSSDNTFLSGMAFDVPFDLDGCHHGSCCYSKCYEGRRKRYHHDNIKATWCGRFEVSKPGAIVNWAWSAAVYKQFSTDYNALGVKPIDSKNGNPYHNYDNAGTPGNFKQHVVAGARGDGKWSKCGDQGDKYAGSLTQFKKANLGLGVVCMGAVDFDVPLAADNCDGSVTVTTVPAPGSVFGPGTYTITATAVDSSGNSNTCLFTLKVLSPLQVVFETPCNDNLNDNACRRDSGWNSMNCPDDPSTTQYVTKFDPCDNVWHKVRLLNCEGEDVTCEMSPYVTVHIDVTLRKGNYSDSVVMQDIVEQYSWVGNPGGIMVPSGSTFNYLLETAGFPGDTIYNNKFFRSCVWVDYNSAPGIPVGMEDIILESK